MMARGDTNMFVGEFGWTVICIVFAYYLPANGHSSAAYRENFDKVAPNERLQFLPKLRHPVDILFLIFILDLYAAAGSINEQSQHPMQNPSHETVVGGIPQQQQQNQQSDLNNLPIKLEQHYGGLPPQQQQQPPRNPMEVSEQEKEALHQYRVQPKYESNMIKNEYKR